LFSSRAPAKLARDLPINCTITILKITILQLQLCTNFNNNLTITILQLQFYNCNYNFTSAIYKLRSTTGQMPALVNLRKDFFPESSFLRRLFCGKFVPRSFCERVTTATAFFCYRVARWYIFEPKIPIWANFRGPSIVKGSYIICLFGMYYGHSEHLMAIRLFSFNLTRFPPFWYIMSRKIWQPWVQNGFLLN
jgi:hypothetical protein